MEIIKITLSDFKKLNLKGLKSVKKTKTIGQNDVHWYGYKEVELNDIVEKEKSYGDIKTVGLFLAYHVTDEEMEKEKKSVLGGHRTDEEIREYLQREKLPFDKYYWNTGDQFILWDDVTSIKETKKKIKIESNIEDGEMLKYGIDKIYIIDLEK